MEVRLIVLLAFTSAAIFANTFLIWFAYKRFATATSAVVETLTQFESSAGLKTWLDSAQTAAQDAVDLTENLKGKLADGEAYLRRAQEEYGLTLVKVDTQLEKLSEEVAAGARKMSDAIAKPASSVRGFSARLSQLLGPFKAWP